MLYSVNVQRKLTAMSHRELAEAAGVSRPFVTMILHGQRSPSLTTARRMAQKLGVSTDELVEYLDSLLLEPAAA